MAVIILLSGCGKERKNLLAKSYHATNSFFNGYYNATRILKDTRDQLEDAYTFEDNNLISIYVYPDDEKAESFEADMEKITEKNDIVIFKHPNGGFEDDCRLLTGISYVYRRDWVEARNNFEYIINSMPGSSRVPEAQIWMALAYYEEGQIELAADYLQAHIFDYDTVKIKSRIRGRLAALGSRLAVDTNDYAAATGLLLDNVNKVRGRKNKTEALFLLGQLADRAEKYPEALEAFARVQRMSKDYEFVFMAKMKTAGLYTKYQGGKDDENLVYEYLNKLLKDPKNEPYHDQIYYQFGTLALKKDSLEAALGHFRKAVRGEHARTRALAGFTAGNIFYREFQQYDSAQVYYDLAAAAVSEDAPEYNEIKTIAEVFGKYVEYKTTITYQDSMLWLASLSEEERNAAITKVIEIERAKERKAEEERQAKLQAEQAALASARSQFGGTGADRFADQLQGGGSRQRASNFYFDNPGAVAQGLQQFKQRWGNRANEDDWRRVAKSATFAASTEKERVEKARQDSIQLVKDSALVKEFGNDYQFYKDVPRNDTMIAESNAMIEEAMFKLGQLYFQRMNEPDSAVKTFETLLNRFDPCEFELETRYALYQLYKALDNPLQYVHYNYIVNEHPNTVYAYLLQGKDPRELARVEDDYMFAYTGLFAAYRDRQYETAIGFGDFLLEQFAGNDQLDMAELNYIRGMSYGYLGQKDSLRKILTEVIKNFPESDVTPQARLTLEYFQQSHGGEGPPELPKSGGDTKEQEANERGLSDPNNPRYQDFGKAPKSGEKIFVLMYVDQEEAKSRGLTKNEINAKIGDFNNKEYPKLKPFTFQYKGTILLPYVSHFQSTGEALAYVESFRKSQVGKEVLSGSNDKIFYISHSNFKVGYGRKRLEDYILFYEHILEKNNSNTELAQLPR
ncbi:MAG: tetratricopeptide repeat protein [Bacteroidia bacterium]